MKKQLNEIKRMQQLAGLLNEAYNAIDSSAPDWRDYEGYETVLEGYFDQYDITDAQSFKDEQGNGDLMNNLAFNIAKRSGFEGNIDTLIRKNVRLNRMCNFLAEKFMLQYAIDTFLLEGEDKVDAEQQIAGIDERIDAMMD